jgi:hypothetical protein
VTTEGPARRERPSMASLTQRSHCSRRETVVRPVASADL